jgi:hypothetical protein
LKVRARSVLPVVCCALLSFSVIAIGDEDDKAPDSSGRSAQPSLNSEQQRAAGIAVAHPLAAKATERIEGLGLVLDATTLVSDLGETTAAAVAEHSASAELARLRALHEGGAAASLKMLDAAQADQARARAQAQIAAARFALRWGPLAALPIDARQRLIEASTSGRSLLVRADLPGRHTLGARPDKAVLDVDGILVPGRVLGILRETTELQSVGLLIEVPDAPQGLGPGARMQVAVLTAERNGMLLPRDALLYDAKGAYVYRQLTGKAPAEKARYAPVKVNLLLPYGDGWLVEGIDEGDNIVVHGAGVLWSLEGAGAHQPDDADD